MAGAVSAVCASKDDVESPTKALIAPVHEEKKSTAGVVSTVGASRDDVRESPTKVEHALFKGVRYSPKRMVRLDKFDGPPLQGGHWVFNKEGAGCTISVLLHGKSGPYKDKIVGLTAAHLASPGQLLYVPVSTDGTTVTLTHPVATVVEVDHYCDTATFVLNEPFQVPYLCNTIAGIGEVTFAEEAPKEGDILTLRGARRRGVFVKVVAHNKAYFERAVASGVVCPCALAAQTDGDDSVPATDDGDCGAAYVNANMQMTGTHHALIHDKEGAHSYFAPMALVRQAFPQVWNDGPPFGSDRKQHAHLLPRGHSIEQADGTITRNILRFENVVFVKQLCVRNIAFFPHLAKGL